MPLLRGRTQAPRNWALAFSSAIVISKILRRSSTVSGSVTSALPFSLQWMCV